MRIIDVSVPIREAMPVYPGDAGVSVQPTHLLSRGDPYDARRLSCSTHCGTHIDAPGHFIPGAATVDQLSLDVLIGPAWVVEVKDAQVITGDVLSKAAAPSGVQRLLIKTQNSRLWAKDSFDPSYAHLSVDGAAWLVQRGVKLVGIDYLSVEGMNKRPAQVHLTLLGAGVIIVEGLDLSNVSPGPYQLVCLPLKVQGADGAPARVALIQEAS